MTIEHKEGREHSMFFIEDDGDTVAELVYSKRGNDIMVIEHTEVDKRLQGKNIGFQLVQKAVEYAREKGLKISPVCFFAKAVFDKRMDFKDVLA